MLILLVLSGIFEGIGLSAVLPLIAIVLGDYKGGALGVGEKATGAEQIVRDIFGAVGLTPTLELMLILILVTMLLKCLFIWLANKRVGYTVAHLTTELRLQALRAFILARWEFHLKHSIGKLSAAMGGETAQTARAYAVSVSIIVVVIQAAIYIGVALTISWEVTLIALAVGAFFWYPLNRFVKKSKKAGRRQVELRKSMSSTFVDSIQSIKPLKAMAREDRAEKILVSKTEKLKKALQKQIVSNQSLSAFQEVIKVAFMLFAIYMTIAVWGMAPASVMILILLLGRIMGKLSKIQSQYQQMATLEHAYWSMMETLEFAQKMREQKLGDRKPELKHAVRLEGLKFAYSENNVINDVTLIFPAGEFIAIIGSSGAGKTTIVDLVTGLLRPQAGDVWIDDLPLEQVDLNQWRRMIGYVPQETLLLHESIFVNVTLGDSNITEQEAEVALQKAGIWEFVKNRPKGIHSSVGQRGLMLSGGQRQRIAIARALVRNPKLLILDEATTALDPETEAAICETLRKLRGEITILAISHQSAVLEVADRAYSVLDGKVVLLSDFKAHAEAEKDASSAFV
ncbi:MAG: ATP-binding cassette domain-containing protein [Desulfobacterales bacterium]